jgi:hypothetical protein
MHSKLTIDARKRTVQVIGGVSELINDQVEARRLR